MRIRIRPQLIVGALLVLVSLSCVAGTSTALAMSERPGWELSATTYPSNLVQGVDEVQEVVANPAEATFALEFEKQTTVAIPNEAKAAVVQADLEILSSVGKSNVSVSEAAAGTYLIEFTGTLGDTRVAELGAQGASVSVKTQGGASGTIGIDVFNVGAGASSGQVTVTDTLPSGLKAKEAGDLEYTGESGSEKLGMDPRIRRHRWDCTGNGPGNAPAVAGATVVTCTNDPTAMPTLQGGGGMPTPFGKYPQPPIGITVEAGGDAKDLNNRVSIAGGGAPTGASTHDPITVGPAPAQSGLTSWDAWFSNADGTIDTQAGSHPYEATTVFNLATILNSKQEGVLTGGEVRNLEVKLPSGFIGDTAAVTQCTHTQLEINENGDCPVTSEVGTLMTPTLSLGIQPVDRVYNMVPPPGEPAEFGFKFMGVTVLIDFSVRTGGDDGITARISNIPQRTVYQSILTIWGTPSEHSHDLWRAPSGCTQEEIEHSPVGTTESYCTAQQHPTVTSFLTLPTSCGSPQPFSIRELSGWQEPEAKTEASSVTHDASDNPAGFTGCENLTFGPFISTAPDTAMADTPTGLSVEVKPPVGGLTEPGLLGTADIKNTTVALPPGVVINPGQAAGLQACSREQAALEMLPGGEENDGPAACPNASKVGTVLIQTPLLEGDAEKQLDGDVYVLQSNPPNLKLLIAATADGVNLKLVGNVSLCEATGEVLDGKTCQAPGQLITSFDNTPQLPFTLFKLSFSGGPQAALDTPTQCGTYASSADFEPWASPFVSDFMTGANFSLTEGPAGSACPSNPLPFSPSLIAGATTDQAGGFTSFSMLLRRGDGQQRIEKLSFKIPQGLAGMISQVPLCDEADANAGTCPAASRVGHSVVTSGPGPYPLVIPQPGEPEASIYLTGPYKGAPFGLSIVTPVIAGPFNLGTIVTRASIAVDPYTAQITVTTDPLPQIVKGVPTDLREVDAVIDRPGFMFNPTNCTPQTFSGTATSSQGAQAAISSAFGMGSCQSLKFNPKFTVSTSGKTSRANGASLSAKVSYPLTPQGTQADISSVKVALPKQLPSRLSTLQKACISAQFDANPAGCPAASKIGYATVNTQLLPVPLTGPAIFVSHGGEAFPSLTIVLQGDNVTVNLVGTTFINKAGITSTTFKSVPDVPFKTFTLTLPEGKYSALAANGNLCKLKLKMPTIFNAQNGLTIKQSTPINVTGCTKHKTKTKKAKNKAKKK
jgi:hypothetical protein